MHGHRNSGIWLVAVLLVLGTSAVEAADAPEATEVLPASSSPAIDAAAAALAEGRLDAAQEGFEAAARDASLPPFARSLAWFGVAQTALARKDVGGAIKAWQQLAGDASLPEAHRDTARRRIAETERIQQGLPGRDPAAYRAELPTLPEPAAVFHVAPSGSDAADGSEAKPFGTLEKARDAVRAEETARGKSPQERSAGHRPRWNVSRTADVDPDGRGFRHRRGPGRLPGAARRDARLRGGVRITTWRPISDAGSARSSLRRSATRLSRPTSRPWA